jgi:hypothetical protein
MRAMFLHFDEQLLSGLRTPPQFTQRELIFWLNLYALLHERLLIPANFFVDADQVNGVLRALRLGESSCPLMGDSNSINVLWDRDRFPVSTFAELVRLTGEDPAWATHRTEALAQDTAAQLDQFFPGEAIRRVSLEGTLAKDESVRHLHDIAFNAAVNAQLDASRADRLTRCLNDIHTTAQAEGLDVAYGRNFYYMVCGYQRRGEELPPAYLRPAEIVKATLVHSGDVEAFLTCVDYVAHRLKTLGASRGLGHDVELIVPQAYMKWVMRNDRARYALDLRDSAWPTVPLDEPVAVVVDRDDVINLSASQLTSLKGSTEFARYSQAWRDLRAAEASTQVTREATRQLAESLRAYLNLVAATLSPRRNRIRTSMTMAVRAMQEGSESIVSLAVEWLANSRDAGQLAGGLSKRTIEVLNTYGLLAHRVANAAVRTFTPVKEHFPDVLDIAEEIRAVVAKPSRDTWGDSA